MTETKKETVGEGALGTAGARARDAPCSKFEFDGIDSASALEQT